MKESENPSILQTTVEQERKKTVKRNRNRNHKKLQNGYRSRFWIVAICGAALLLAAGNTVYAQSTGSGTNVELYVPEQNSGAGQKVQSTGVSVKTGDDPSLLIWQVTLLTGGMTAGILLLIRQKKRDEEGHYSEKE